MAEKWERLVDALGHADGWTTAAELADRLGVTTRTIRNYAAQANSGGVIVESGPAGYRLDRAAWATRRTAPRRGSSPAVRTPRHPLAHRRHRRPRRLRDRRREPRERLDLRGRPRPRARPARRLGPLPRAARVAHHPRGARDGASAPARHAVPRGVDARHARARRAPGGLPRGRRLPHGARRGARRRRLRAERVRTQRRAAAHRDRARPRGREPSARGATRAEAGRRTTAGRPAPRPRPGRRPGGPLADLLSRLLAETFGTTVGPADLAHLTRLLETRAATRTTETAQADAAGRPISPRLPLVRRIVGSASSAYLIDLDDEDFIERLALHVDNLVARASESSFSRNPLTASIKAATRSSTSSPCTSRASWRAPRASP